MLIRGSVVAFSLFLDQLQYCNDYQNFNNGFNQRLISISLHSFTLSVSVSHCADRLRMQFSGVGAVI